MSARRAGRSRSFVAFRDAHHQVVAARRGNEIQASERATLPARLPTSGAETKRRQNAHRQAASDTPERLPARHSARHRLRERIETMLHAVLLLLANFLACSSDR